MSRPTLLPLASLLAATIASTVAWDASANCAAGDHYGANVEPGRVTVCPFGMEGNESRGCPDTLGGMLRQNVATGEVVRLAESCTGSDRYEGASDDCYLDECVAPGIYRYGFAQPWSEPFCRGCPPSQYFVEVEVTADDVEACVRSEGIDTPDAYPAGVPWGEESDMCNESGFGCSFAARPRAVVFGVNALVALLGVTLMLLRRRRRTGA